MRFDKARQTARNLGFTLSYNADWEEYRLCPIGQHEASAYYTDDVQDALDTARYQVSLSPRNVPMSRDLLYMQEWGNLINGSTWL